jgi:hypothetical protein
MLSRQRIFPQADAPILTLLKRPQTPVAQRTKTQFKLLVRHLLDRFFNNDMISVGGDAVPLIMTIAYAIALPTVVMAIFAYPFYHAFPPRPHVPPFWFQVSDHYFFVMYSFVAMGAVTIFDWDLLFPNLLDIFILSILPISNRRLLLARMSAVLIFLTLFLIGTGSLGMIFFPAITELPGTRLFAAHFVAITASGVFAAALVLALQGVLINLLGARLFRLASTFIQTLSMTILLTVLSLYPLLTRTLKLLIGSSSPAVRYFPPFWFLGIYECILAGPSKLPAFASLARTGCWATAIVVLLAFVTYPLAHKRRTRQAIEGTVAPDTRSRFTQLLSRPLHAILLRTPSERAVYHFIGQTILRTQRHRVYLAMYAGLGAALIAASAVVIGVEPNHVSVTFSPYGLRLAIPAVAFWTVAGLRTALTSPSDPGGSWAFRLITGRPTPDHLTAIRIWVLTWSLLITMGTVAALHFAASSDMRGAKETAAQILVAAGLCILLTDAFFLKVTTIPFTEARVPLNTDLAFVLLRYIVVFPTLVFTTANIEPWIEASAAHLIITAILILAAHIAMRYQHDQIIARPTNQNSFDEEPAPFLTLGLRR